MTSPDQSTRMGAMGSTYDAIAFGGWFLIAVSWAFFRKPGVRLFSTCTPWRPQDYVRPLGVFLWTIGGLMFVGCMVAFIFLPAR